MWRGFCLNIPNQKTNGIEDFEIKKSLEAFSQSKRSFPVAENLAINIDAHFEYVSNKEPAAVYLWPCRQRELTPTYAGVGIFLLRKAFQSSSLANHQFALFDLLKCRLRSEKCIPAKVGAIIESDAREIQNLFVTL